MALSDLFKGISDAGGPEAFAEAIRKQQQTNTDKMVNGEWQTDVNGTFVPVSSLSQEEQGKLAIGRDLGFNVYTSDEKEGMTQEQKESVWNNFYTEEQRKALGAAPKDPGYDSSIREIDGEMYYWADMPNGSGGAMTKVGEKPFWEQVQPPPVQPPVQPPPVAPVDPLLPGEGEPPIEDVFQPPPTGGQNPYDPDDGGGKDWTGKPANNWDWEMFKPGAPPMEGGGDYDPSDYAFDRYVPGQESPWGIPEVEGGNKDFYRNQFVNLLQDEQIFQQRQEGAARRGRDAMNDPFEPINYDHMWANLYGEGKGIPQTETWENQPGYAKPVAGLQMDDPFQRYTPPSEGPLDPNDPYGLGPDFFRGGKDSPGVPQTGYNPATGRYTDIK